MADLEVMVALAAPVQLETTVRLGQLATKDQVELLVDLAARGQMDQLETLDHQENPERKDQKAPLAALAQTDQQVPVATQAAQVPREHKVRLAPTATRVPLVLKARLAKKAALDPPETQDHRVLRVLLELLAPMESLAASAQLVLPETRDQPGPLSRVNRETPVGRALRVQVDPLDQAEIPETPVKPGQKEGQGDQDQLETRDHRDQQAAPGHPAALEMQAMSAQLVPQENKGPLVDQVVLEERDPLARRDLVAQPDPRETQAQEVALAPQVTKAETVTLVLMDPLDLKDQRETRAQWALLAHRDLLAILERPEKPEAEVDQEGPAQKDQLVPVELLEVLVPAERLVTPVQLAIRETRVLPEIQEILDSLAQQVPRDLRATKDLKAQLVHRAPQAVRDPRDQQDPREIPDPRVRAENPEMGATQAAWVPQDLMDHKDPPVILVALVDPDLRDQ